MSYYRTMTGGFTIEPHLPWKAYRDSEFVAATTDNPTALRFTEITETVNTDEGQLLRRTATGLVPRTSVVGESPRHEVIQVAKLCTTYGVELCGTLYVVGEDDVLDTWRYYTDSEGRFQADQAILVWPNGRRAHEAVPHSSQPGCERLTGHVLALSDTGPVAWPDPIDPARILRERPWAR